MRGKICGLRVDLDLDRGGGWMLIQLQILTDNIVVQYHHDNYSFESVVRHDQQ
jgi:hypothetical protein